MATKKKPVSEPPAHAGGIQPGDDLHEGVAVRLHDDGWLVGRVAEEGEAAPAEHTVHRFGARTVFLSHHQAPIPAERLHKGRRKDDDEGDEA